MQRFILIGLILCGVAVNACAQNSVFGKNKVRIKIFIGSISRRITSIFISRRTDTTLLSLLANASKSHMLLSRNSSVMKLITAFLRCL